MEAFGDSQTKEARHGQAHEPHSSTASIQESAYYRPKTQLSSRNSSKRYSMSSLRSVEWKGALLSRLLVCYGAGKTCSRIAWLTEPEFGIAQFTPS